MSLEEAIARAREIAAKLGAPGAGGGDLGKRKFEDMSSAGLGSLKKKKVYIPIAQNPDINYLGLLIGPKGSTQKQMQERTGAKVLIRGRGSQKEGYTGNHPDDDDELHVAIEGSDEAVDAALKEVEQILFNPEEAMRLKEEQFKSIGQNPVTSIYGPASSSSALSEYHEELKVPNGLVGLIIGRGGENVQKLQLQTGAHIQIAKETDMLPGETHRSIFLHGGKAGVNELRRAIEEIITTKSTNGGGNRGNTGNSALDNHAIVMKVPVPNERVGYLIGKGGMNVRGMQEKTRTFIHIPPGPDDNDPNTRTISIGADTKEQADAAHAEIYALLQQCSQSNNITISSNSMLMCVPDDKVGIIIGRGGVTIKDIQTRHRVRVQIPQQADLGSNPPVRTCSITGPTESQMAARYEIEMILQGQQSGIPQHVQSSYSSYSAASAYADPNAAAWATYGQAYDTSRYASYYGQTAAVAATPAVTAIEAVPTDPTAYYKDYWQYASYYGEVAARAYYGAWSPPAGTPPPPGTTIPGVDQLTAAVEVTATQATPLSSNTTVDTATYASESSTDASGQPATDAWEAYKKQYAEWYEAYGKAMGADPNPPAM